METTGVFVMTEVGEERVSVVVFFVGFGRQVLSGDVEVVDFEGEMGDEDGLTEGEVKSRRGVGRDDFVGEDGVTRRGDGGSGVVLLCGLAAAR